MASPLKQAAKGALRKLEQAEADKVRVYHGSPYKYDKVDPDKIGSGEGSQAFGYGLYGAENSKVADEYRRITGGKSESPGGWLYYGAPSDDFRMDNILGALVDMHVPDIDSKRATSMAKYIRHNLAGGAAPDEVIARLTKDAELHNPNARAYTPDAIRKVIEGLPPGYKTQKPGWMYTFDINARPEHFLDLDAPLDVGANKGIVSNIHPNIRDAISERADEFGHNSPFDTPEAYSGKDLHQILRQGEIQERFPDKIQDQWLDNDMRMTAAYLESLGVPGTRFYDKFSRQSGEGTRNYVVFPESSNLIDIVNREKARGGQVAGFKKGGPSTPGGAAVKGALSNLEKRDAPHGPNMPSQRVMDYVDPPNERIDEWKWRPLPEVASQPLPTEVPEHVLKFGDYMHTMSKKAGMEGFDSRDILKAYTDTLSSIQRTGRRRELLEGDGLKLSSDSKIIRPEGAFADWLGSPEGQKYLLYGSQGETHPDMVEDAVKKMRVFGLQDKLREQLTNAPQIVAQADPARISTLVDRASRMASHPDEWRDVTEGFSGIGPAKGGFLAAMLGAGHIPTLDARQILLHTGRPTSESKPWSSGARGDAGVDRLIDRQAALDMYMPTQYEPERQHLTHHTFWDALEGQQTTHKDMIDMMLNRAEGGYVPGFKKGTKGGVGQAVEGALRKLEEKDLPFHKKFENPGALKEPNLSLEEIINRAQDVNLIDRGADYTGLDHDQLVQALRTQKPTVGNPDVVNRQGITNLMDPNAIRNATARIYDPQLVNQTPIIADPSKLLGHNLTASMSDLSAAGPVVTGAGGYDFSRNPIITTGGPGFTDLNRHLWANADEGVATAIRNAVRGTPDKPAMGDPNLPTLFMTNSMGLQSHDQSDMMMQGIAQMLAQSDITKGTSKEFDQFVRASGKNVKQPDGSYKFVNYLPDFPGVKSENLLDYLLTAPMANRAMLPKMMDKGNWNKRGIANPLDLRMALTDPGMLNVPTHTPGRVVGSIDLDNLHGGQTLHGSYPQGLVGQQVGKLDKILPWRDLFHTFGDVRANVEPRFADRAFQLSPAVQVADQEWLDRVGPIWENAMKANWAEGGAVPGFSEGGQDGEPKYFPRVRSFFNDTVGDYVSGLPEAQDQWQRKKLWEDEGKSGTEKFGERLGGGARILLNNALSGAQPNLYAGARYLTGSPKTYAELVSEETGKTNMAGDAAGPYATAAATTLGGTLPFIFGRGIPAAIMNWADTGRRATQPADSVLEYATNLSPRDEIQDLVGMIAGHTDAKGHHPGVIQYLKKDLQEGARHMKNKLGLARGGALRGYLQGGDVAGGGAGNLGMPGMDLGAGIIAPPGGNVAEPGAANFGIDDLMKMADPGRKTPDPLKFAMPAAGGAGGGGGSKGGGIGSLLGPIGAIAGSFIPGVGTAIGGAIGGLAGQAMNSMNAATGGYVSDLAPPHGYAEGGKVNGGIDDEMLAYHVMNFARGGSVPGFDDGGPVSQSNSELWPGAYDPRTPKPLTFGGNDESDLQQGTTGLGGLLGGILGGGKGGLGGLIPMLVNAIKGDGFTDLVSAVSPVAAAGKGLGLFAEGGRVPHFDDGGVVTDPYAMATDQANPLLGPTPDQNPQQQQPMSFQDWMAQMGGGMGGGNYFQPSQQFNGGWNDTGGMPTQGVLANMMASGSAPMGGAQGGGALSGGGQSGPLTGTININGGF